MNDTGSATPSVPTSTTQTSAASRARAILGGSAGNLVEWYDWFAYAAFSIYFAKVFFPEGDQTAQFMKTAAIFAVGFLARPVGAWLMGLYADRAGRRAALTLAVALMSVGSLIIALTPGFNEIGPAAPAILLAARILQGLSVGGEYGASATYMSEMAGKKRRGFWSSFQYVTLIMGQLVAALVLVILQATLTPAELSAWGWRVPFFIGAALAVIVFWIRAGLHESASFTAAKAAGAPRAETLSMFRDHPREALAIIGLTAAGSLAFYAYTTYMLKFLTNTTGFSKPMAGAVNLATLVGFMLIQPLFGWMSDKVGRRRMLIIAFGGGAILAWPIFSLVAKATDPVVAFLLIFAALVVQSAYTSISAVVKAELFPVHVRALGVALPYAIGNALFGGTAEYVALWFKNEGMESGFYLYLSGMMAIGCLIAWRLRDSRDHSLILED
ncbi:alpha-ketoglutarate permease [Caulobacter sp. B11]|uniref:MFS transporter n=1 Tax=Caulobacter sp. B11 TaxID=2048899 RepID=UPI000C12D984|nr:MFS transporter [Caulobacter sp. B11]PHY13109.1 alpha-ketoglutarate permease [Caulobacter sp. B11]